MNIKSNKKDLSPKQRDELLAALKARFDANKARHPGLVGAKVQARLEVRPEKLWSLAEMERTGGEPDVVGQDKKSGEFVFMDCSAQSPKGRVSFCYDRASLDARKEHKPKNCVLDAAAYMGVGVLTEEEYFALTKSCRDCAGSNVQHPAKPPPAVVRFRAVVTDEDAAVTTITINRAAEFADLRRRPQPARRLRVELAQLLQREIFFLRQHLHAHVRRRIHDAVFGFVFLP